MARRMCAGAAYQSVGVRLLQTQCVGFLLIGLLLILWEVSARFWVDSVNWPPVSAVFRALALGVYSGELGVVALSSLIRMSCGFLIGALLGVAVGLLMARSRYFRAFLDPSIELIRPIPIPAIVPPLILVLGVDDAMKVSVIAFSSFFPILINTIQGASTVERTLLSMAHTFRINKWQSLSKIVFPAALPYIFAGLRISLSLAFIVTIVAEMIAGSQGLGYYLVSMQYAMRPSDMYAGVLLLAATGYTINEMFLWVERKTLVWHNQGIKKDA